MSQNYYVKPDSTANRHKLIRAALALAALIWAVFIAAGCSSEQASQVSTEADNSITATTDGAGNNTGEPETPSGHSQGGHSGAEGGAALPGGTGSDSSSGQSADRESASGSSGRVTGRVGQDGGQITMPTDPEQARQAARVPDISPPKLDSDTVDTGSAGSATAGSASISGDSTSKDADTSKPQSSGSTGRNTTAPNNGDTTTPKSGSDSTQQDKATPKDSAKPKQDDSEGKETDGTSGTSDDTTDKTDSNTGNTGKSANTGDGRGTKSTSGGSDSVDKVTTTVSERDPALEEAFDRLTKKPETETTPSPEPSPAPEFRAVEVKPDSALDEAKNAGMEYDPCLGITDCDPQNPFPQPEPTPELQQQDLNEYEADKCHENPDECEDSAQQILDGQLTLIPGKKGESKIYDPDDPICEKQWWQPGCVGHKPTPEPVLVDEYGRKLPNLNITSEINISDATLADLLTPGDNETGTSTGTTSDTGTSTGTTSDTGTSTGTTSDTGTSTGTSDTGTSTGTASDTGPGTGD